MNREIPYRPAMRKVANRRLRIKIQGLLEDFPRQSAALDNAMAAFDDEFSLSAFKPAYETLNDMDAYNDVQALERAVTRVQNYVSDLAEAAVGLAAIDVTDIGGSPAQRAFAGLRDANVITSSQCRQLTRAHKARAMIEHAYIGAPAGDVHAAALLVRESSTEFILSFRPWISPLLDEPLE